MGVAFWVRAEFRGARLPDQRFRAGLYRNVQRLFNRRGEAWSSALGHDGRQRARRLLSHRKTTVDELLAGHYAQTGARCRRTGWVLVATDTTPVDYRGHGSKGELGPISGQAGSRGLFLHTCLAMRPNGSPLGLLGMSLWTRAADGPGKATRRQRLPEEKESHKWVTALEQIEARLPEGTRALVIDDREGDVYPFLAAPRRATTDLLVRAAQDRRVRLPESGEETLLFAAAAAGSVVGRKTVTVPRQARKPAREATLTVRARRVELQPPKRVGVPREPQVYWLIEAREEAPPEGEEAVCWVLLTTLDCATEHSPLAVVGYYGKRWRIEDFHKVLKSGMGVEQLQIETLHHLQNAVAVLAVVAWRVMALTWEARDDWQRAAEEVLEPERLEVLRAVSPKAVETARDVVWEIARLAGYEPYRNGPPPGPKRIWLGVRRLEDMVAGYWLRPTAAGDERYEP